MSDGGDEWKTDGWRARGALPLLCDAMVVGSATSRVVLVVGTRGAILL